MKTSLPHQQQFYVCTCVRAYIHKPKQQTGGLRILEEGSTYSNAEGSRRVEMFWGTEVKESGRPLVLTGSGSCMAIVFFERASQVLRQLSAAAGQEGAYNW
ncbi:uncharacterized protein CCR75_005137 [Bremia lactucae]|uniref:Uncharacterized protein n=1 Tax=Bremia lactucae TaxID=4779 RepID=A0A976IG38_BRELC|nr:hypothetical protein CCR75_005137 [Bremia lactucae]